MLASIDMFRFDLQRFGYVMPETRQRVYDEELSYIAEGLNRPLCSEFTLHEQNGELVYFDRGTWRPYVGTLVTGLKVARLEASYDPRKSFQSQRAAQDLEMGYQMQSLLPGQRLCWYSGYPEKEARQFGEALVGSLGYQPKRRLGFLYEAVKNLDGSVSLYTQSVDNSDEEAFAAAMMYKAGGIDAMRAAYDAGLGRKRGGNFYAGQLRTADVTGENAWESISRQKDLVQHYLQQLEHLARAPARARHEEERDKKRLTYAVWAALKERLDRGARPTAAADSKQLYASLDHELQYAYRALSARGEVLFGCGGLINGEEALLGAEAKDVFDAVFGDKSSKTSTETCEFISKSCPKCSAKNVKTVVTKTHISGSCGCRVKKTR